MTKMKVLLAGLLAGFFMSAQAEQPSLPNDAYEQTVPMLLHCVTSFPRMIDLLADHGEIPIALMHMSPRSSIAIFTNEKRTTSTVVVMRQEKYKEEVCVLWAGKSTPADNGVGMSFSLNPNPVFPEEIQM
jgi:hypothetical protein